MGEILGGFSGLKFRLILVAGFIVVACMVWNVFKENREHTKARAIAANAFANPSQSDRSHRFAKIAQKLDPWAVAGLTVGTSFIVAILCGSLMRVSFKKMVVLIAVVIGVSVFLDYKGVVEPFWSDYLSSMPEIKSKLLAQTESMRAFLHGHFPPFAGAVVGFGFGLKR